MEKIPIAQVVSVGGSPSAPTPSSAAALPTLQNEGGAKEFLSARRWPDSLQDAFIQNVSRTPLRFFICDDSGSMQSSDGQMLAQANGATKLSSTVARNERTVQEIRRWASTNHPVDVTKAFPSEYEIHIRIQEAKEEVVKLEKEREVAYERLRVAQEEFQKKQDETTRQIVEMEERHAKKLSDAIERARRGGGFWSGLLSVVVPVLTRVLL
eukprot:gene8817-9721_t